ncbi:hypothetical protein NQ314_018858 [Rhamnusium bicolor]|uniref:Uncharacterized protein n=1 Tax=Rhamnusium bicolor TaxID=1586634 RepID=A0AAV8WQ25_9CUCU|nr:hypothetical protein NQ314_018858 [Rhamnusium bicolor]
MHGVINGYKNGITSNGVKNGHTNGFSSKIINGACEIFQHLLSGKYVDDDLEDENLQSYYSNDAEPIKADKCEEVDESNDVSESQVSLIKYMEELKK